MNTDLRPWLQMVLTIPLIMTLQLDESPALAATDHTTSINAARKIAQAYLQERWIPDVEKDPQFFDLVGVDVSHAILAAPFLEYILRGDAVERFLDSGSIDPREFVVLERYAFPVMLEQSLVASIIVQRNKDENDKKFDGQTGDYFLFAVTMRGNFVDSQLMGLRIGDAHQTNVGWIQFVDSNLPARFVVERLDGTVISGPSERDLVPLEDDSRRMKAVLRAERERRPRENSEE